MEVGMKTFSAAIIGLTLSALLYFGEGAAEEFAYYVFWTMTIMASLVILCGMLKDDVLARARKNIWINTPVAIVEVAAMIGAGYPGLAAYHAILVFVVVSVALSPTENGKAGEAR